MELSVGDENETPPFPRPWAGSRPRSALPSNLSMTRSIIQIDYSLKFLVRGVAAELKLRHHGPSTCWGFFRRGRRLFVYGPLLSRPGKTVIVLVCSWACVFSCLLKLLFSLRIFYIVYVVWYSISRTCLPLTNKWASSRRHEQLVLKGAFCRDRFRSRAFDGKLDYGQFIKAATCPLCSVKWATNVT